MSNRQVPSEHEIKYQLMFAVQHDGKIPFFTNVPAGNAKPTILEMITDVKLVLGILEAKHAEEVKKRMN